VILSQRRETTAPPNIGQPKLLVNVFEVMVIPPQGMIVSIGVKSMLLVLFLMKIVEGP